MLHRKKPRVRLLLAACALCVCYFAWKGGDYSIPIVCIIIFYRRCSLFHNGTQTWRRQRIAHSNLRVYFMVYVMQSYWCLEHTVWFIQVEYCFIDLRLKCSAWTIPVICETLWKHSIFANKTCEKLCKLFLFFKRTSIATVAPQCKLYVQHFR